MITNSKHSCEKENNFISGSGFREIAAKPSLLLHSCCGPCSTAVTERLVDEFDVTVFFYNPCITDEEEYRRRKEAQLAFIEKFNEENIGKAKLRFKEGDYRPTEFFKATEGLEKEPEGGARCSVCFAQRLEKTAETAKLEGFDYFGTTLTVSPHKNYKLISEIGRNIALRYGLSFLDRDFKKKDGFKRSIELSKKYELYRQDYCGCKYSKPDLDYVNIVIDNKSDSTDNLFTYGCEHKAAPVGSKVYVPFAKGNRLKAGYVVSTSRNIDEEMSKKLKYVEKVDEEISLTEEMIRTAIWLKQRYLCRAIDAIGLFTPAGSKAKRKERKNPFEDAKGEASRIETLTDEQAAAFSMIGEAIDSERHDRFLIHGITGSGKTEVYIRAAEKCIANGRNVIILVPEISLTGQIIDRFIGRFGSQEIAVLHSKLSLGERYDQWKRIRDGKVKIVIGARSAVFAPLEKIGMIVVDEEHEATYKSDQTPKYDTVEVALKRLQDRDNKGVLVLGSATPSIVSYSRAEEGIYKLIKLTQRYNKVSLPLVEIADMRLELKNGNKTIISARLYSEMKEQLEAGRQVMLLLNRRGYSTFISCRECGYVAVCPHCGLSLTYHRNEDNAVCHYCGYAAKAPVSCPDCESKYIRYFGSGTEKLEETVAELFEGYTMERLDLDTVRKKGELERKLKAFQKEKTDILIGTQLIAKGLDFRNVGLVGIISADVSLNIPDFRSPERAFQLITQAAGRAGRGDETGHVIIQTYSPEHYAVSHAANQDYEGFYEDEKQLRKYMGYPPYSDLIQIVFMAADKETSQAAAEDWHDRIEAYMKEEDRNNLFKPQEAYMSRINDSYRFSMLIKCPKGKRKEYTNILAAVREEDKRKKKKEYTAVVDINPYSFS